MSDEPPVFSALDLLTEGSVRIAGGDLEWVPVRRRLGIGAFGTNAYRAARAGESVVEEHVESPGQEELYLVVRGAADFLIAGERVTAPAGTLVFVRDPGALREAVALEDETVVLAVGGWRDRPYHSLPWEPIYLAQPFMRDGDWAAAADLLEREAGQHLDTGIVQYRLAYCRAREGRSDAALRALGRAIEINPDMRSRAEAEEHFAPLRERADWPNATG